MIDRSNDDDYDDHIMIVMVTMLLMQVEPTETDRWTQVQFVSEEIPVPAFLVVVSVFRDSMYNVRISDVTADACIPYPRKYCLLCVELRIAANNEQRCTDIVLGTCTRTRVQFSGTCTYTRTPWKMRNC